MYLCCRCNCTDLTELIVRHVQSLEVGQAEDAVCNAAACQLVLAEVQLLQRRKVLERVLGQLPDLVGGQQELLQLRVATQRTVWNLGDTSVTSTQDKDNE